MAPLPGFRRTSRKAPPTEDVEKSTHNVDENGSSNGDSSPAFEASDAQIKRATRTRFMWSLATSAFLFITVIFLIVVEIGNTSNQAGLTDIWFIKLDLSNVVPTSIPNASLLNSIARTLGLHDFYTVGLWGYCEGYNGRGVTNCSPPQTLYAFNPVTIIQSELLAGSSILLPDDLSSVLHLISVASQIMFAFFLAGACVSFVLMFFTWTSIYSRWAAFAMVLLTLLNAILVVVATVIATVMFIIMRNVFASSTEVNIGATIGTTMFALMWVAAAFALFAFVTELCLMCCCASRRDVRRGKKWGNKKAWN